MPQIPIVILEPQHHICRIMVKKTSTLLPDSFQIIQHKATEPPFSGKLTDQTLAGTYLCRNCGLALFRSQSKFHSGCGWPSFDAEIPNTVMTKPDADGRRTEILCQRCQAHLGHVFQGEGFTAKNIRHCVNSLSLDFVEDIQVVDTEEAIFAAGCFWGVEYYFKKLPGVLKTEVGYTGGHTQYPTYQEVCAKKSGHLEAIRVIYDRNVLSYEQVVKYFFEIHDPTQTDGQGPDRGPQYLSALFPFNEQQNEIAQKLIGILSQKGMKVATQIKSPSPFWPAEDYHQDYYAKENQSPYCHIYTKRFS